MSIFYNVKCSIMKYLSCLTYIHKKQFTRYSWEILTSWFWPDIAFVYAKLCRRFLLTWHCHGYPCRNITMLDNVRVNFYTFLGELIQYSNKYFLVKTCKSWGLYCHRINEIKPFLIFFYILCYSIDVCRNGKGGVGKM